ncbi:hypothetical protein P7K49_009329 [Saguinus oedipus]|uniref:Uncharacterized protein n=1 Tax=Saguinus oedipus TaxID=9490 RepID=A0ABQ9VLY1_SAGOE|nr:hypothetical protein P7K49_009329 [Saguinus oedipus]
MGAPDVAAAPQLGRERAPEESREKEEEEKEKEKEEGFSCGRELPPRLAPPPSPPRATHPASHFHSSPRSSGLPAAPPRTQSWEGWFQMGPQARRGCHCSEVAGAPLASASACRLYRVPAAEVSGAGAA